MGLSREAREAREEEDAAYRRSHRVRDPEKDMRDAENVYYADLAERYGLSAEDLRRIRYPDSDDPFFDYSGHPETLAGLIADEKANAENMASADQAQANGQPAVAQVVNMVDSQAA